MKKLIVANWKANPESLREAKEIFLPVKRAAGKLKNVEVVFCPPAVWLASLSGLALGGQDAFWELSGAYTGRLGPTMIRNAGANYVILGHSEMRNAGDTDDIINAKLRLALRSGLKVILCVGEKERDERGDYLAVLREQLEVGLSGVPRPYAKQIILAYEPVWAIGAQAKGADTPAAFLEQSIYLRKILASIFGKEAALVARILYGGSAKAENAAGFLKAGEAGGLLVGRASLDAAEFIKILKIANEIK